MAASWFQLVIIVYVEDFIGAHRIDYDIAEVTKAFRWGALQEFAISKTQGVIFKGKQLTFLQCQWPSVPPSSSKVRPREGAERQQLGAAPHERAEGRIQKPGRLLTMA